jgi:hypothetical protein
MTTPTTMPVRAAETETGRMRTPDMMGADDWTAWKYLGGVSIVALLLGKGALTVVDSIQQQ